MMTAMSGRDGVARVRRILDCGRGRSVNREERFAAQLAHLDTREDHLLDLSGDPCGRMARSPPSCTRPANKATAFTPRQDHDHSQAAADFTSLGAILEILAEPQRTYRHASDSSRGTLNRSIVAKLYRDADARHVHVRADELPPAPHRRWE